MPKNKKVKKKPTKRNVQDATLKNTRVLHKRLAKAEKAIDALFKLVVIQDIQVIKKQRNRKGK